MEYLDEAREELKRVDHLVYVSLKYTRTVDVIRSIVERMINALGFCIMELLEKAKIEKKIPDIPNAPTLRCELLESLHPGDESIRDFISFYQLLRKILKATYTKREEYRRHVAMISTLDSGDVIELNIDILKDYYDKSRAIVNFIHNIDAEHD